MTDRMASIDGGIPATPVEYLNERLAEDEVRARDLIKQAQALRLTLQGPLFIGRQIPGWHMPSEATDMCARVLADIAAKREIVEAHDRDQHYCPIPVISHEFGVLWSRTDPDPEAISPACWTILLMVRVYADRPDFPAEWAEGANA